METKEVIDKGVKIYVLNTSYTGACRQSALLSAFRGKALNKMPIKALQDRMKAVLLCDVEKGKQDLLRSMAGRG